MRGWGRGESPVSPFQGCCCSCGGLSLPHPLPLPPTPPRRDQEAGGPLLQRVPLCCSSRRARELSAEEERDIFLEAGPPKRAHGHESDGFLMPSFSLVGAAATASRQGRAASLSRAPGPHPHLLWPTAQGPSLAKQEAPSLGPSPRRASCSAWRSAWTPGLSGATGARWLWAKSCCLWRSRWVSAMGGAHVGRGGYSWPPAWGPRPPSAKGFGPRGV